MTIKTKVLKRPELNFWQRLYLPELLRGILITSRHFWKNLFFHFMHQIGLFKAIRAAVTIMYPEEKRALASRARTRHRLTQRADGSPRKSWRSSCRQRIVCSSTNSISARKPQPARFNTRPPPL